MAHKSRRFGTAWSVALLAGAVAAAVAYLLFRKPQWRRAVVEIGHHLLNVAEGLFSHNALEGPGKNEE